MIKFKLYRWFAVLFGGRSFIKKTETVNAYAIIHGGYDGRRETVNALIDMGFEEEWPILKDGL